MLGNVSMLCIYLGFHVRHDVLPPRLPLKASWVMATLLKGIDGKRDETLEQDLVSPCLFPDPSYLNNGSVGQWGIVRK